MISPLFSRKSGDVLNADEFEGLGSSMAEVIRDTATLPASDRDAIAAYIESLPRRPTPDPGSSE